MNEKDTVTIPRDEYDALIAIENNTRTLERLARKNGYMNINDALVVLGFELEDGGSSYEQWHKNDC